MKKFIAVLLATLFIGFVVFALAFLIDSIFFNSKYTNKLYGSDCLFEVPEGYKLMYSQEENNYVVAQISYGDVTYLSAGKYGISNYHLHKEPSKFDDSCQAKAYLKAYIIQQQPKIKGYK